jgi:hypothetical protein
VWARTSARNSSILVIGDIDVCVQGFQVQCALVLCTITRIDTGNSKDNARGHTPSEKPWWAAYLLMMPRPHGGGPALASRMGRWHFLILTHALTLPYGF